MREYGSTSATSAPAEVDVAQYATPWNARTLRMINTDFVKLKPTQVNVNKTRPIASTNLRPLLSTKFPQDGLKTTEAIVYTPRINPATDSLLPKGQQIQGQSRHHHTGTHGNQRIDGHDLDKWEGPNFGFGIALRLRQSFVCFRLCLHNLSPCIHKIPAYKPATGQRIGRSSIRG